MACVEHYCPECGKSKFDNRSGPAPCRRCGSPTLTFYDELAYEDRDDRGRDRHPEE